MSDSPGVLNALEDLLDRERGLLLAGDLDMLARLSPRKISLLERLPLARADQAALDRLRGKADRNQVLLAAVARGIKSVSHRLDAIREGRTQLRTYDRRGHSQNLATGRSSFEKRS